MLTGEAKKEYQREYMQSYMRKRRAVKTQPLVVKTPVKTYGGSEVRQNVTPLEALLDPALITILDNVSHPELDPVINKTRQAKWEELQRVVQPKEVTSQVPLYNPAIHRPGDKVQIMRYSKLVEIIIPELDAEGQPMPFVGASSIGYQVSNNIFKPSFIPVPKIVKGKRKPFGKTQGKPFPLRRK